MENTKNALNGRIGDILGTYDIPDLPDASEYDFVKHYRDYVALCVAQNMEPEDTLPYSKWVEEMLPTFSIPTELGKRIRLERHKLGEPAWRFAEACGITRYTLSNIENGKHPPTLQSLIRIADVIGLPLDDLLGRTVNTKQRDHLIERRDMIELRMNPIYVSRYVDAYYKKKYGESRESYVPEKTEENTEDSKN